MVIVQNRRKNFRPSGSAGPSDPYWSSVVLLLHCDGTNGSTTFTDSSSSNKTATANGNAQITTTNPKFGSGAYLGDGNSDSVTFADTDDWHFGSGDWTVEFWLNLSNNAGASKQIIAQRNSGVFCPFLLQTNSGILQAWLSLNNATWTGGASPTINSATTIANNTWYHIALCRGGTSVRLFIDGTQVGSTYNISTNSFTNSANVMNIGGYSTSCVTGRIDELRITKGVARYTANFTAPTEAFPNQ
jgi:hypothetical protein